MYILSSIHAERYLHIHCFIVISLSLSVYLSIYIYIYKYIYIYIHTYIYIYVYLFILPTKTFVIDFVTISANTFVKTPSQTSPHGATRKTCGAPRWPRRVPCRHRPACALMNVMMMNVMMNEIMNVITKTLAFFMNVYI